MSFNKDILWVEKYRPKTVKDCILPSRLKDLFQDYVDKKEIPNLILTGSSGVGKTTIARAICDEIDADYILINGSNETGIDTLRGKVMGFASTVSLTGGRKVVIIDEADYLSNNAQAAFRGVIEEFASNCSFIFTCNLLNRVVAPLRSRCAVIHFELSGQEKQKMGELFYHRVIEILKEEKITFDKKVVGELIIEFFPDYRRILNEMQRYSSGGTIDIGILAQITDINISELVGFIKKKDFKSIRLWVGSHTDNDSQKIMRDVYDKLNEVLQSNSVPAAVVLLGKYQYQSAFVADQEINLMAFLTELLVECEFK